jgi:glycosyltransferase involved in cell wall biosynthesis
MKQMPWKDAYSHKYFIIANSPWTAKMASMMYGYTPPVILGGLDHNLFHPVDVEKEYDLLCCCPGDRPEKGLDYITRVSEILGLPLTNFAPKDLPQSELATEYSKAKVFIGAPIIEGNYQPGLEAMACGTPVGMGNAGGNAWYARDGENCFITPRNPGDLAYAVYQLLKDKELQDKFIKNGLETVKELDWKQSTIQLEQLLKYELEKTI